MEAFLSISQNPIITWNSTIHENVNGCYSTPCDPVLKVPSNSFTELLIMKIVFKKNGQLIKSYEVLDFKNRLLEKKGFLN